MISLTTKALKEAGYTESAARRIVKLGVPVGGQHVITVEDLLKEYQEAKRKKERVLEGSRAVRADRVEEDCHIVKRSARESFGVGRKSKRGRRGLEKQSFEVIEGGANRLDVSEVRK